MRNIEVHRFHSFIYKHDAEQMPESQLRIEFPASSIARRYGDCCFNVGNLRFKEMPQHEPATGIEYRLAAKVLQQYPSTRTAYKQVRRSMRLGTVTAPLTPDDSNVKRGMSELHFCKQHRRRKICCRYFRGRQIPHSPRGNVFVAFLSRVVS